MNNEEKREIIRTTVRPYWSDMDALGHVNNAKYFTYFEEARLAWFSTLHPEGNLAGSPETGPVIITASCTFKKMVVVPAVLEVIMYAGKIGNTSFDLEYEVIQLPAEGTADVGDVADGLPAGEVVATGESRVVWVNYAKARPVQLPHYVKEQLTGG